MLITCFLSGLFKIWSADAEKKSKMFKLIRCQDDYLCWHISPKREFDRAVEHILSVMIFKNSFQQLLRRSPKCKITAGVLYSIYYRTCIACMNFLLLSELSIIITWVAISHIPQLHLWHYHDDIFNQPAFFRSDRTMADFRYLKCLFYVTGI